MRVSAAPVRPFRETAIELADVPQGRVGAFRPCCARSRPARDTIVRWGAAYGLVLRWSACAEKAQENGHWRADCVKQ